jgi:hypothetical protein
MPTPPPPPPPLPGPGRYRAKITRRGLGWEVDVHNRYWRYGPDGAPFYWWGTRRYVVRRAHRLLARLNGGAPDDWRVKVKP